MTVSNVMQSTSVIIIDDSPTLLKVLSAELSAKGFAVRPVVAPMDGVALLQSESFDVLVVDFVMPGMTGLQLIESVRSTENRFEGPIVMMLTAESEIDRQYAKALGVSEILVKPFPPQVLSDAVQSLVEKQVIESSKDNKTGVAGNKVELAKRASVGGGRESEKMMRKDQSDLGDMTDRSSGDCSPVLFGQLDAFSPAAVFSLMESQSSTGLLSFVAPLSSQSTTHLAATQQRFDLHLKNGMIALVNASGVDEKLRLGYFIVQESLMTQAEFDLFLKVRSGTSTFIGHQLVSLGYIGLSELRVALRRQGYALVNELLLLDEGEFYFSKQSELMGFATEANMGLRLDAVLMEALRYRSLPYQKWPDLGEYLVRNDDKLDRLSESEFSEDESYILSLVDGRRRISDIVQGSDYSPQQVTEILTRLISASYIRRVTPPLIIYDTPIPTPPT